MCCGREIYEHEEQEEGQVRLTRRQAVKAMGAGVSLIALSGLTGCTSLIFNGVSSREIFTMITQNTKARARVDWGFIEESKQALIRIAREINTKGKKGVKKNS